MLEKLEKAPARANKAKHDRTCGRRCRAAFTQTFFGRSQTAPLVGPADACVCSPTVLEVLGLPEHVCSANSTGSSGDLSLLWRVCVVWASASRNSEQAPTCPELRPALVGRQ